MKATHVPRYDPKMSDKEKVEIFLAQAREFCEGDYSKINAAMIVIFTHRYKGQVDYFTKMTVRSRIREELGELMRQKAHKAPESSPIIPMPKAFTGVQLPLFRFSQ